MPKLTAAVVRQAMPSASSPELWADPLNASLDEFEIDSPARVAAFLAQIAQESGELRNLVEKLSYSAAGLRRTWPNRFSSDDMAAQYERQPERIANYVYANRLGNGDEASGDGWAFRGRGLLQITGRSNYRAVGIALALPLESAPETLVEHLAAARSAGLFWKSHGLNELADLSGDRVHDQEDFVLITKRINGGTVGLAQRLRYWAMARKALGIA